MAAAAAAGRTHGILLCKPQLEPLYAHLGWSPIVGEVTFTEPDRARQPVPLLVMVRPLTGEPWPAGNVDLAGLPF